MRAHVLAAGIGLVVGGLGGCAIAQTPPPPVKPLREIAREERGEILTVRDTKIDLSTGRQAPLRTSTPPVGVGPFGVRVPISIGGEKKVEVPAEEMTIQLASGRLISIVQELSSPPFAPGERVRVQYERVDDPGTPPRMQVVRQ
jgi:hypothetical protein